MHVLLPVGFVYMPLWPRSGYSTARPRGGPRKVALSSEASRASDGTVDARGSVWGQRRGEADVLYLNPSPQTLNPKP